MIIPASDIVLDIQDVADQVGVKASSIKYYWKHGRMPMEDVTFNGTPGWYRQTINDWRPAKAVIFVPLADEEVTLEDLEIAQAGINLLAEVLQATKAYPTDPQPLVDEWVPAEGFVPDFGGYEPELGYVIDYGDDESLGMADALADIESEFGTLVNEEI